jgi:hypothetical protein
MHTPTHAALNFLVLGRRPDSARAWILIGAVLPDVPMCGFFLFERYARHESLRQIFEVLYFEPRWQTLFDASHSIPLFLMLAWFCWWRGSRGGLGLAASLLLHALVDWPTHLEDAHAYFWPLWRQPLPGLVSYWHRESLMWVAEILLICGAVALWVSERVRKARGREVPLAINARTAARPQAARSSSSRYPKRRARANRRTAPGGP